MTEQKYERKVVNFKEFEEIAKNAKSIWVFGYGSIMWKPGFRFNRSEIGYIKGYTRKMYQGNYNHRGTEEHPGRVAMLIQDDDKKAWGVAFELVGRSQLEIGLEHLGIRECRLGGYQIEFATFYSRNNGFTSPVVVFNAAIDNDQYLGEAPLEEMAMQIAAARGRCGFNSEYLTRIADYVRENIPEDNDEHLFQLDALVKEKLARNGTHWMDQWRPITATCPSVEAILNDTKKPADHKRNQKKLVIDVTSISSTEAPNQSQLSPY